METTSFTPEDFLSAANRCRLPSYSMCSNPYHPCWLAPTGQVITGDSHLRIAVDTVGSEPYDPIGAMYDAGYLRVQAHLSRRAFSIEGHRRTRVTPEMRVTLAKLLRTFKVEANETSFICLDDMPENYRRVTSTQDFLRTLKAVYVA